MTAWTASILPIMAQREATPYQIDPWGNLYQKNPLSGYSIYDSLTKSVNAKNQFTGSGYDLSGNMTSEGGANYTYDAENRLISAGGVTYTYDAEGKRVKKSSGVAYIYGAGSDVLTETNLAGGQLANYVYMDGKRIVRRDYHAVEYYYLSDHLGSTRKLVTKDGTVCSDVDYHPWGETGTTYTDTCPQNYKFTGKERDSETGLDYFGARYYGPNMGRFMTPDWSAKPVPVAYALFTNPQTLNLYSYTGNNPLSHADLDGHCWPPSACAEAFIRQVNKAQNWVQNKAVASGHASVAAHVALTTGVLKDVVNGIASLGTVGKATGAAMDSGNTTQKVVAISGDLGKAGGIALIGAAAAGGVLAGGQAPTTTALSTSRLTGTGETFTHYGYASDAGSFTNGLRPGGFATTESGLTGAQAQSGLALPHATAPDAAYTVTPGEGTPIITNPVTQPAFGQPGGLPETQFPMGTGPGSVSAPKPIAPN